MSGEEQEAHIVSAANLRREAALPLGGRSKDGVPGGQGRYRLVE